MTAIAKTRPVDYTRLSLSVLRELACQMHPDHDEEATREYVTRLIDLELERRLDLVHRRPGWHPSSPGFGDGTGKSSVPVDAMLLAYEKGIPNSYWHEVARKALSTLSDRRLLAVLVQEAKADHRTEGPFSATYDQIAASVGHYAQLLAFAPGIKALGWFPKGQAIKRAAWEGRMELILQAKGGGPR